MRRLELDGTYRSNPAADLGGIGPRPCRKKCVHDGLYGGLGGIVCWFMVTMPRKIFSGAAVPIFGDIVVRGEACVDKDAKAFADLLASVLTLRCLNDRLRPRRSSQNLCRRFCVVRSPSRNRGEPLGRCAVFCDGECVHYILQVDSDLLLSQYRNASELLAITS